MIKIAGLVSHLRIVLGVPQPRCLHILQPRRREHTHQIVQVIAPQLLVPIQQAQVAEVFQHGGSLAVSRQGHHALRRCEVEAGREDASWHSAGLAISFSAP